MSQEIRLDDDTLFDRLVDGHLSADERRQLLEALDSWPAGWRRCALAFLEAQSWGEEFKLLAHAPISSAVVEKIEPAKAPPSEARHWPKAMRWMALAASLMIAFVVGRSQHQQRTPLADSNTANRAANAPGRIVTLTQPPAGARPTDNDALTFWVRDGGGQRQQVRVPLVDAETLDKQYGVRFQPGIPGAVRDHLQNRGYRVESKRRYAPLWLENGRPMIVPVEDTKIVPSQENAF
jgi:hypothetical protein